MDEAVESDAGAAEEAAVEDTPEAEEAGEAQVAAVLEADGNSAYVANLRESMQSHKRLTSFSQSQKAYFPSGHMQFR